MVQELLGTLLLLAALAVAGYLVWTLEQPRCPRCGKRLSKQEVELVGGCLSCYEEAAGGCGQEVGEDAKEVREAAHGSGV